MRFAALPPGLAPPRRMELTTPMLLRPRLLLSARACTLLVCALLAAGCSPYKFAGDQLFKFGEKAIMPHELAGTDLGIGCRAATAFTAPGMAFERVGTDINQMSVLLLVTAGVCTELSALEHELTYLRAAHAQNPLMAQDARIAQKRAHALAARRQYAGYLRFMKHYKNPAEGRCPKLKTEFDELVFMVGLLGGVQAVINDAQAGQFNSVPRDIAPLVGHLSNCLDSEKWWDLPLAVRAAMWSILPMLAPEGVEPMKILEQVAHRGERDGVRLGHLVWAMTAYASGDQATTRRALRDFAASTPRYTQNAQYRILDTIAGDVMLSVSDRMWSEAVGHRTPMGALGTFWDDRPVQADISDLLK